jgi:hypothetical protein
MNKAWLGLAAAIVGCGGVSGTLSDDGGGDAAAVDAADGGPADGGSDAMVSIALGGCTGFTPCGGDVAGTWSLSAGCIDDPLAASKSLCPMLVVNSEEATASGSVTFASGMVSRDYTTHYAMDVTIPAACLQTMTCAQLQSSYQAYIPNTTCSVQGTGCRCSGSLDTTATQGSTYATSNDQIVTGGGDHYDYCVSGDTMQYHHVSGPTAEIGSYTLSK